MFRYAKRERRKGGVKLKCVSNKNNCMYVRNA